MINKQDVIQMLDDYIERLNDTVTGEVAETVLRIVRGKVEDMPEQKVWIPCSERLPDPEEPEKLLITDDEGMVWCDMYFGCADEDDIEPCFYKWDDEYWYCSKPNVVAWMPLPDAYKEVQE